MKATSLLLTILAFAFIAAPASADSIAITNSSFAITSPLIYPCGTGCASNVGPIPGWTITGAAGSWQPNSTYFNSPVPATVAWSDGGTISQTLGASLAANTTYTLSVDVGHRLDGFMANYTIELLAGNMLLDALTGSNGIIPLGTFQNEFFGFTTGNGIPTGGLLGIALIGDGKQIDFTNVQLTATPVPEPASLALLAAGLGLVLLVLRRR